MERNTEDLLWDYIDGRADNAGKAFIEELIATQETWRNKYHEFLDIHQLMNSSLELEEPSMRFSQNVMEEIAKYQVAPATKQYINKKIINGLGIFFVVMVLGAIAYGLGQANWSELHSSSSDFSTSFFNKIDYSKFFNNTFANVFMLVNVVIGLMLLDMYLGRKKQAIV